MRPAAVLLCLVALISCQQREPAAETQDYPFQPVPFTDVHVRDAFWAPRIETNRTVTIPVCFRRCEETGRINNFLKAAGKMEGPYEGRYYNDSDVYKVIEGAAYSLALHPDPELDSYLDDLIAIIAAAQEPDGYLYAIRTIGEGSEMERIGDERWTMLIHNHELYNVGHLYEAAVAHYRATGKRSLLDVAVRNANLVCETFGPNRIHDVPGHQEIEIGLVKLYRITGNERYLETAKFFLDERGHPERRPSNHAVRDDPQYGPEYVQDHLPVIQQTQAVGHAVRAGYLYSGMADVAAITGDQAYRDALDRIWESVAAKRMYLTGGVGARATGEAFGEDYELPNATAYAETCAAVANALWNHRMFLLSGDAGYIDVLERVLYNGFLSGVSLSGDLFFYQNPLAADGKEEFNQGSATRAPWFRTSCCPVNVARTMPSIPGYVYATRGREVYVNLYVASEADIDVQGSAVRVSQQTEYPWDGHVRIAVALDRPAPFALKVRIPGWARNQPVPTGLYRYAAAGAEQPSLTLNGESVPLELDRGYVTIEREWRAGDRLDLTLPMPVHRVLAHEGIEDDRGRVALERGPVVYCVEGPDNGGDVADIRVADSAELSVEHRSDLLGGVTLIKGPGLTAIPYYAWSNRGPSAMAVWLPRDSGH